MASLIDLHSFLFPHVRMIAQLAPAVLTTVQRMPDGPLASHWEASHRPPRTDLPASVALGADQRNGIWEFFAAIEKIYALKKLGGDKKSWPG